MFRSSFMITTLMMCLVFCFQGCTNDSDPGLSGLPDSPPDDAWFQEHVVDNPKLVVVDFYADWCGPCRQLSPLLEKLQAEYDGQLEVVKVNVDEREVIAAHYGVSSIPMVLVMYQGNVLTGIIGLPSYNELEEMVKPHLSMVQPDVVAPVSAGLSRTQR